MICSVWMRKVIITTRRTRRTSRRPSPRPRLKCQNRQNRPTPSEAYEYEKPGHESMLLWEYVNLHMFCMYLYPFMYIRKPSLRNQLSWHHSSRCIPRLSCFNSRCPICSVQEQAFNCSNPVLNQQMPFNIDGCRRKLTIQEQWQHQTTTLQVANPNQMQYQN